MKSFALLFSVLLLTNTETKAVPLARGVPEEQGVSSAGLQSFVSALDSKIEGMHSVMVVRHGKVIVEGWWAPYNAESRHTMYSLSKSFTSTAIGLAIAEKKLSLDDTLLSIFPAEAPENPSANLKGMRVRDLLAMSTGHHNEDISKFNYSPEEGSAIKDFLAMPVAHKPGTHFVYNTPASFILSASVQKRVGQPIVEYLRPRLFEPLGIEGPIWETNKQGINLGGFGLNIRTEDIAKFGQLYLQKGNWNGKQLLPARWVAAATKRQTSNGSSPTSDWDQGYGYQFWRCRNGAYRGDGAFGQYCIVMPEQDAVVAITSGVKDMQAVMNVVWDALLPEFKANTLPADSTAEKNLRTKLGSLTVPPQQGAAQLAEGEKIIGKKFVFEKNPRNFESLILNRDNIEVRISGTDYKLPYAPGKWQKSKFAYNALAEQPAAVSGAWSGDSFVAKIALYETPYLMTLRLKPDGEKVLVDQEFNVGFGPSKSSQITGRVE
jgi:CubicO group peptidase (beta-lactamase class C family)